MRPETALQRQIRQYIAAVGFHSVHVPNGAVLSGGPEQRARQMNSLKRDGLMPGFPDLLVYGKGQRIGHIEVKTPKGKIENSQILARDWLEGLGHKYAVCRSVDDAREALQDWGWLAPCGQKDAAHCWPDSTDSATQKIGPSGAPTPPSRDPISYQERTE